MKYVLILLSLFPLDLLAQKNFFDIQIQSLDGRVIDMNNFKGKKIVVASVSPDNLQNHRLSFLDSLQASNPSVVIIGVPAFDFGGSKNEEIMGDIKKNISSHVIITTPGEVKKDKGVNQNKLLRWLTNAADNSHFNGDVVTDDQLYFISESGTLYAVLEKGASVKLIDDLLKQEDVKQ